jgi:hypothetical protein
MPSRCKSCQKPVVWVETEATAKKPPRMMPIDAGDDGEPLNVENGNLVFTGQRSVKGNPIVRYLAAGKGNRISHFATCEHADQHRKKAKK